MKYASLKFLIFSFKINTLYQKNHALFFIIPKIQDVMDACKIFGIDPLKNPPDTLKEEYVHTLYRQLVVENHPDKIIDPEEKKAGEEFVKKLNNARSILIDYIENPKSYVDSTTPKNSSNSFFSQGNTGVSREQVVTECLKDILELKFAGLEPEHQRLLVSFFTGSGLDSCLNPKESHSACLYSTYLKHCILRIFNNPDLTGFFFSNVFGNFNLLKELIKMRIPDKVNFLVGLVYAEPVSRQLILLLFSPSISRLFAVDDITAMVGNAFDSNEIRMINQSILSRKPVTGAVYLKRKLQSFLRTINDLYGHQLLNNLVEIHTGRLIIKYCENHKLLGKNFVLLRLREFEYRIYEYDGNNLYLALSTLASEIQPNKLLEPSKVAEIFAANAIMNYDCIIGLSTLTQLYPGLPLRSFEGLSVPVQEKLKWWLYNQQVFFRHPSISPQLKNFIDALGSHQALSLIENNMISYSQIEDLFIRYRMRLEILAYLNPLSLLSLATKAGEYNQLLKAGSITDGNFNQLMHCLQENIQGIYKNNLRLCKERPLSSPDQLVEAVSMTSQGLSIILSNADNVVSQICQQPQAAFRGF